MTDLNNVDKSYVSMEEVICPICGQRYESGTLLFDRRLRNSLEHTTLTGFGNPCKDCQSKLDDHYVALVVAESPKNHKGQNLKEEDADRTGEIIWMKESAAKRVFNLPIDKMAFIDPEAAQLIHKMAGQ